MWVYLNAHFRLGIAIFTCICALLLGGNVLKTKIETKINANRFAVITTYIHVYISSNNKNRQINKYIRWQYGREPTTLYPQKRVAETTRIAPNPHRQHHQRQITAVLCLYVCQLTRSIRRSVGCGERSAICASRTAARKRNMRQSKNKNKKIDPA